MLPYISGGHMTPGEIQLYGAPPLHAWLPVGRFPEGVDEVSDKVAADLREAGFRSESDPEVMVKKRTKLLSNIGNSMVALRDPGSEDGEALIAAARAEALACYEAAGLATMDPDVLTVDWEGTTKAGNDVKIPGVDTCAAASLFLFTCLGCQFPAHLPCTRRRSLLNFRWRRFKGSSFYSLAREAGDIECAYLNGEMVRSLSSSQGVRPFDQWCGFQAVLGGVHGVPTPANIALQRAAARAAADRAPPGTAFAAADVRRMARL